MLLIAAMFMCLLLPGCELENADSEIHGRWISFDGLSFEFTTGRYIRRMTNGELQRGTYVTNEGNLTLHRTGFSSETIPYSLEFPVLVIGEIKYYHDSSRVADDISGTWFGYYSLNSSSWAVSSLWFGELSPQRDNPKVLEGRYVIPGMVKGEYTVSSNNLPNTGIMTMRDTHVSGGALSSFIQARLLPQYTNLFDQEALKPPGTSEWWFTSEEASKLFADAARKALEAGDAALAQRIQITKIYFIGMYIEDTTNYEYTLTKANGPVYDFDGYLIPGGDTILTLISENWDIITFINSGFQGGNMIFEDARPTNCYHTPADGLFCCRREGWENNGEASK